MRLGDLDKLKEALSSKDLITWTYEYGDAIPVDWLMSTIDNAPTVAEDYNTGYQDGLEDGLNDIRPQGEWLKSDIPESVLAKCSLCGFDCGSYTYNYCPNCGANMRGEEK